MGFIAVNSKYWVIAGLVGTPFMIWPLKNMHNIRILMESAYDFLCVGLYSFLIEF